MLQPDTHLLILSKSFYRNYKIITYSRGGVIDRNQQNVIKICRTKGGLKTETDMQYDCISVSVFNLTSLELWTRQPTV